MENGYYLIEKAFFVLAIFKFLYLPLPLFSSCQALLGKLIKYKSESLWCHQLAKQEFKNILSDMFRKKVGLTSKLGQLMKYLLKNIFMGKLWRKYSLKTSPKPFLGGTPIFVCHFFPPSIRLFVVHHIPGTVHCVIIIFGTPCVKW